MGTVVEFPWPGRAPDMMRQALEDMVWHHERCRHWRAAMRNVLPHARVPYLKEIDYHAAKAAAAHADAIGYASRD